MEGRELDRTNTQLFPPLFPDEILDKCTGHYPDCSGSFLLYLPLIHLGPREALRFSHSGKIGGRGGQEYLVTFLRHPLYIIDRETKIWAKLL